MNIAERRKMFVLRGMTVAAVLIVVGQAQAQAQTANVTPENVAVFNLLSPFLSLNTTAVGQQTLQAALSQSVAINQNAPSVALLNNNLSTPALAAMAISDENSLTKASNTVTGLSATYGVAANLAGGLPTQNTTAWALFNGQQPIGGFGSVLGAAYVNGIGSNGATVTLPKTVGLLVTANTQTVNNIASSDSQISKFYFANGTIDGTTPAVAPAGSTLPKTNGLPNKTNSVYDTAFGVSNTQSGQNAFGNSHPYQTAPVNNFPFTLYDTTVKSPSSAPGAPTPSTNPAFPSSHEAYSETDSLLLGMMVPQLYQSMLLRASEMGESRIVIGVHYPIDIIGSRSFIAFDLANLLGNPSYINNAAVTGTAINLPSSFVSAELELKGQLTQAAAAANCGTSLASCATSSTNVNPYAPSANNTAVYDARMTYGLPTLSYAQAPREQAPAGGPDASILLATLYGGSSPAALALTGGIGAYGNLSTAVINQIILNTESPALAAFYGTPLSYWSRLDLYDAAGYFQNITGTISLAGSDVLKTDAIVGANGTLAGIGTIYGNLTNTAGGVVAPSGTTAFGAIGGMSISGNYVQGANSTLQIQPSSVGAAGLAINGMATIAGTLQVTPATGFTASLGQSYPVLTAGQGVSGLFTSVSEPTLANGGFYQPIYTSTGVTLLDAQPLGSFGATPNERSVGAVLDALRTTPDPTLQNALSSIYGQEFNTPGAAQAALAQISPQNVFSESFFEQRFAGILANQFAGRTAALRAGATGFSISSSSFNIAGLDGRHDVVGELAQAQPGAASDGYGWFAPGSALGGFLSGQVLFGDRTFVTGGPNNNFTTGGVTAGLDYRIAPYAALGLAGSYFTGTVDAPNGSVDGSGGAISLYGTTTGGGTYIDGFFSGGFNDFTSHRTIGVGGVTSTGAASPDGHFVAFGGDIGHPYDAMLGSSLVHWGPVGEIRYNHAIVNGYTESGLGSLSATVQQRSVNSFQTGLGFEANTEWQSALGLITPRVRATWQHEFMDTTETALATLAVAPSLPFTVTSNPLGRDFAAVSAGLATQVAANVTLSIDYIGEFGQTSQTVHEVAFLARIAF